MGLHIVIDGRTLGDHYPGIGRYLWNLLRALVPLVAEERITLLVSGAGSNTRYPLAELAAAGVRWVEVSSRVRGLGQQLALPRLLRELGAEVFHAPYYLTAYRPPCPLAVTVYDVIGVLDPAFLPSKLDRRAYRLAMQQAVRAAAGILTLSKAGKDGLVEHFEADPERVLVTPAAVDPGFAPASPAAVDRARSRLGLPERYVLHVGTDKPHKNLVRLVRAWAAVRDKHKAGTDDPGWKLVLAGRHDRRRSEAADAVRELGLTGVRFLGEVAEEDLPALYTGAGLFVLPSLAEGFGLPVLEAMACGTAVACSRAVNVPPVAGAAAAYFDPEDVESIAVTLVRLLGNGGYRQMLADRGARHATQFSWTKTAQQTLRFYHRLAGG
jgi:glycosyltransferase involved in cell wall biosynthesis